MTLNVMNGEYFININAVSNRESQEILDIKIISVIILTRNKEWFYKNE